MNTLLHEQCVFMYGPATESRLPVGFFFNQNTIHVDEILYMCSMNSPFFVPLRDQSDYVDMPYFKSSHYIINITDQNTGKPVPIIKI